MSSRLGSWLDRFGATGSLVCAIHCALLPLLITAMPALGVSSLLGERFEQAFILFASLLGLFSLTLGYRRHRALQALGLLLPGLTALWLAALYPPLHVSQLLHGVVMALGGLLVGLGHMVNLRLSRRHVHGVDCPR
ncbi:hypothetical protein CSC70_04790 [Pseudoxanthomonas kalamensis DSM 18571]|uniref:MerC domain-containing protein n=1 Tax=Pseudoxanthomonas kalamensis TaxID=289483 RepID=UPI0013913522|nr:MerC domain-containing protein [Pseudoxanthomonas kalamensis]KAF1711235.1 hypothetical protein CSC70_04790 [Pseudoxanthomonas kalamensis DSM 18571]